MNKDEMEFEIVNIVATGDLQTEIYLEPLSEDLGEKASIDNSGLNIRFTDPEQSKSNPFIKVFESGKYNILGVRSVQELEEEHEKMISEFKKLDDKGILIDDNIRERLEVQNIVGMGNLHQSVNLEALSISLGLANMEYEPEWFPALVYRSPDFNCTFSIFANGKVVITGGNKEEVIKKAFCDFVNNEFSELKEIDEWI